MTDKFFKGWFIFVAVFGVASAAGTLYLMYLAIQALSKYLNG